MTHWPEESFIIVGGQSISEDEFLPTRFAFSDDERENTAWWGYYQAIRMAEKWLTSLEGEA